MHRKWIVPQEGFEGRNPANYTTVKLEMEQLGASWLSILKVQRASASDSGFPCCHRA